VVIDKKFGSPTITKDAVTVAKEIDVPDPVENLGVGMVREVASKTSDIDRGVAVGPPTSKRADSRRSSYGIVNSQTLWPKAFTNCGGRR
jgi:hypothetical protein